MQTAFAYLRVSGRGPLSGDGFPRQNQAIKQYAKSNGIHVVRTFEERGVSDIDLKSETLTVRVDKNRFRTRILPLNLTASWAVERLLERANELGVTQPEHYLIPSRVSGKAYDPTQPPSRWGGGRHGERSRRSAD